jgi:hypothetical protein
MAIITLGLTAGAVQTAPVLNRVVSSAQSFRYYFRDLKKAGTSLNPIERFVFSLVLANPKAPEARNRCAVPEHRTT